MKALHLVFAALLVVPGAALAPGGMAAAPASSTSVAGPATLSPTPGTGSATPGAIDATPGMGRRVDAGSTDGVDRVRQVGQVDRPTPPPTTVNALGIRPNVSNRSDFPTAYVDLGPALEVESAATSHRLQTIHAVDRVEAAGDDAERTARLRTALGTIETRTNAIRRTQRQVIAAYLDERLTARGLLVELAELDHEARALDDRRRQLWEIANRTDAPIDDARFVTLGRELDAYEGPVRAQAAAVLTGETGERRFYVAAMPRGVVLATLTEDTYLREAYRGDLRRVGNGEMSGADAVDAVAAGYPEVWRARDEVSGESGRVARVRIDYRGGRLEALLGSGNGRVFADEHRRDLAFAGTNATAVNTRDGLRMTVNRSYAGGPMQLQLRDTEGDRVNASVTVGPAGGRSVSVGHTGVDGELWVLTPDQRFTVVAIRGQSVVFLTMDPLATPEPGTAGSGGDDGDGEADGSDGG